MLGAVRKILGGDSNARALEDVRSIADQIISLYSTFRDISDELLSAKTDEFKSRLKSGESVDDLIVEAMATAREAIFRCTGELAYDVQVMGAVALHNGSIAEMRTGEGKTLMATIALYVNALDQNSAHLITVNDYLARRDAQWYGPALNQLGMSVGILQNQAAYLLTKEKNPNQPSFEFLENASRREVYKCDIVYGTNNEFGFDYLRDNMSTNLDDRVQKKRNFAIVDEADSVLIDEARTPLIISGASSDDVRIYPKFARIVQSLSQGMDYTVDARTRSVALTDHGVSTLEEKLGLSNIYSLENYQLLRYMEAALKAEIIFQKDQDYVVKDGQIVIVDAFTGRLMEGRRWSDGIHQAIEAKEGLKIQQESITYATITIQNFFRLYKKLSGMTGTAVTEAEEISKIYNLEVLVIPTHKPIAREDFADLVFRSEQSKWNAVIEDIVNQNSIGRPVLVGTISIETSEMLSELLRRKGIKHNVLNAKQHEREASIIAKAGEGSAVTIATNMAGRGTDIKLAEGINTKGGLHVIGTERHESRRIDNQLRGRSGRQGDPGSTRFYVSFEDDLMKRFAPDWLPGMMSKLGMEENMPLESKMVTRAIEQAQQRVEGYNFDIRKHVVEYDDVMNMHRDMIYSERNKVLEESELNTTILTMVEEEIESLSESFLTNSPIDPETFLTQLNTIYPLEDDITIDDIEKKPADYILEQANIIATNRYESMTKEVGIDHQRIVEKIVLLRIIDSLWVNHLTAMDEMRQGIGLRAYGQTDPLVAYKQEAHDMWEQLSANIRQTVAKNIFHTRIAHNVINSLNPETNNDNQQNLSNHPHEHSHSVTGDNVSRAERRRVERKKKKQIKSRN